MWSKSDILEPIRDRLMHEDRLTRAQQAVRGIDSLQETELHPLCYQAFTPTSHAALREVHYPSPKTELPKDSHRDRCDLVILPEGKKSVYDPVDAHKSLLSASGTLFEPVASLPDVGDDESLPQDAFWVEMKMVAQHRYIDGVPIPNAKYTHELLNGPSDDVIKLAGESQIRHAGALALVFHELENTGLHDIGIAVREMLDRDLPVGMPECETFPICDYAGNAWCTLALIPVRLY